MRFALGRIQAPEKVAANRREEIGTRVRRRPGLDLLRAVAILWVIDYHAQSLGLLQATDVLARTGWMGVDLFFALSGYLIGGQLLRPLARGEPPALRTFYLRRLLRTVPAYAVVLALYLLVPSFGEQTQRPPAWMFLTFTENLFVDFYRAQSFSHAWSLCVEEQFYLLAPLVIAALWGRSARLVFALFAALLIFGVAARGWVWLHDLAPLGDRVGPGNFVQRWMERIYYPTWMRLDDLLAGVALALVEVRRPTIWRALAARGDACLGAGLALLATALFVCHVQRAFVASAIGFPLIAGAMAALVAAGAAPTGLIGGRAYPGASALAAIAYSLYLTHKAVLHLVSLALARRLEASPALAAIVYGVSILAGGALLYVAVERPGLRMRDRLFTRGRLTPASWRTSAHA